VLDFVEKWAQMGLKAGFFGPKCVTELCCKGLWGVVVFLVEFAQKHTRLHPNRRKIPQKQVKSKDVCCKRVP
jgi:hypothetical protein